MRSNQLNSLLILCFIFACISCKNIGSKSNDDGILFTEIDAKDSGINFINKLEYDRKFNIYTYRNFYNGGGVAIGDINNDSLPDVFFTANMGDNKLYLNKGDFKFEDITAKAGVAGKMTWSTGATMVDINADGYMDIHVCNSGDLDGSKKKNEFFINNGNNTFTDKAIEMGLADESYSTHAVFFDYDKDDDLDMYLLNNSYQAIGSFNLKNNVRNIRDKEGGDKLFRNDDGKFVDVSEAAGIYGSVIGFGLGVTVGDIDMNGWPDIYVSNDFFERDYIYMNNGDGTFKENLPDQMRSISVASMGADMADVNNDCFPDIFVTEMLPGQDSRLKTKTTFEDYDKYKLNVDNGYHHQFTRNMLHINDQGKGFTEVGRMAGVHATDWSWGALINDFDNDGWKDLFVSNGIYQDLTDQDFLNFISNEETMKDIIQGNKVDYKKLIDAIPSEPISNYFFKNKGNLTFDNQSKKAGLDKLSHSNGSAYADLDRDGDLDLVVNNVNMTAFVYRNNLNPSPKADSTNYIQVKLGADGKNRHQIGSKVLAYSGGKAFYSEFMPTKGFQSSMDYAVHIGLGKIAKLDSLIIVWDDNTFQKVSNPATNKLHYITKNTKGGLKFNYQRFFPDENPLLKVDQQLDQLTHVENRYVDFDRDRLMYHMLSTAGPSASVADFNGDERDDIYVGGATGQQGNILFQDGSGKFRTLTQLAFEADKGCEDTNSVAIDIDNDKDMDLYVTSGGNEFSNESTNIKDRLYINNGKGVFTKDINFSGSFTSDECVAKGDVDGDGDMDVFVGERVKMSLYGVPCDGKIFINEKGKLIDKTAMIAPELRQLGMITDATWVDINNDKALDLVVVGEYMPVTIMVQQNGKLVNKTKEYGLDRSNGWYNAVSAADLNGDGKQDLVVGNHGLNSRFRADDKHPVCMHVNDFDQNGNVEQLICTYEGERSYPLVLKHDLVKQMPILKKKYLMYSAYKNQTIKDIFTEQERKVMISLNAYTMTSSVLINQGKTFVKRDLPVAAQLSPIYAIMIKDMNNDGHLDILTGGNLFATKPEIGRYDASTGVLCLGDGKGNFDALSKSKSGLNIDGEIRSIQPIKVAGKEKILIVRNNMAPLLVSKR